jgi:hypothetical protein
MVHCYPIVSILDTADTFSMLSPSAYSLTFDSSAPITTANRVAPPARDETVSLPSPRAGLRFESTLGMTEGGLALPAMSGRVSATTWTGFQPGSISRRVTMRYTTNKQRHPPLTYSEQSPGVGLCLVPGGHFSSADENHPHARVRRAVLAHRTVLKGKTL